MVPYSQHRALGSSPAQAPAVRRWSGALSVPRRDLIVFLVAAVLRIAWVLGLPAKLTWVDEQQFVDIGRALAAGHGYLSDSYRANPVLPAYLALAFRIFGDGYLAARIGQALLGALTCVLVGRIARRIDGEPAGSIAGGLAALYLPHIYLAGVFYVDALVTFFSAVAILLVLRATVRRGAIDWLAAGVVLGVTVLTRPVYLACLPSLCAWWLWRNRASRQAAAQCLALALGVAATLLPWSVRNHRVYHHPILVSSGFGTKFWEGNNPLSYGDADDRDLRPGGDVWQERLARLPAGEQRAITDAYRPVLDAMNARLAQGEDPYVVTDGILLPIALRHVREHPVRTAKLFALKLGTLYSAFSKTLTQNRDTSRLHRVLAAVTFYPLLALAAVGAVVGVRRPARGGVVLLLVLIGAVSSAYALLDTCTRFRLPLDPFLAVLAALPLAAAWQRIVGRRSSPGPAPGSAWSPPLGWANGVLLIATGLALVLATLA